jgi:hypothetical protein
MPTGLTMVERVRWLRWSGTTAGFRLAFTPDAWKTNVVGTYTFIAKATDSQGLSAVSAPVTINLVPPPLLYLVAGLTADRQCQLCMSGRVGNAYDILASTNFVSWTNLGPMQSTGGLLQFSDPSTTNLPRRFYRALQQ